MTKKLKFLLIFFLAICFSPSSKATEVVSHGYRVSSPDKTLIQIARDLYSDERLWKKISQWNNVTPPYALKVGQILVLPYAPLNSVASENRVPANELPKPTFTTRLPSVEQRISNSGGTMTYLVNERAPSLSMIALENYGNKKMSVVIAKWNGLPPTARLSLGQKILLKLPPRFSKTTANSALISQWSKMGNREMVMRLNGQDSFSKYNNTLTLPTKPKAPRYFGENPEPRLRPAPVIFEIDTIRFPASLPELQINAEGPAATGSTTSWFGEKTSNSIESLIRSISNW